MSAEESKQNLLSFIKQTGEVAGVAWEIEVGGAQDCDLPSGRRGTNFPIWASGPGSSKSREVIKKVQQFWAEEGYELPIEHADANSVQITYHLDDDGYTFQFGINKNASHMTTQSRCALGNADDLNEQRQREQSATPTADPEQPES